MYGSNIIGVAPHGPWSEDRAKKTFAFVDTFLSECFPLQRGGWSDVTAVTVTPVAGLSLSLPDESIPPRDASQYAGCTGKANLPFCGCQVFSAPNG